jgi:hypothetical protein
VAALEPSVALTVCENALRELMRQAFSAAWGTNWVEKISTSEQRAGWAERAAADQAHTRKGVAQVPALELEYSQFYELVDFADKHWDQLAPALGKKKMTLPQLERFDDLRDRVAHGRTLLEFERELMSGIAGQIRNQVTIYMSSRDDFGDYYPRIDSVIDEFGYQVVSDAATGDRELMGFKNTGQVLRPGMTVRFPCRGTDPQGRDLTWRLYVMGDVEEVVAASGDEATLTWVVRESDVRASAAAEIHMRSSGKYHRCTTFDQRTFFSYSVAPPEGS